MQKDKTQSRLKDLENLVLSQQDRLFALAYIRIGNRLEHYLRLAFRNDNQWQSWEVDGGI